MHKSWVQSNNHKERKSGVDNKLCASGSVAAGKNAVRNKRNCEEHTKMKLDQ
jgi:hypothetical protein